MANLAYIGAPNDSGISIARQLTKAYVGVNSEVPVYEEVDYSFIVTESTLSDAFTVEYQTSGDYSYITWDSPRAPYENTCTVGVTSSRGFSTTMTLTALFDMDLSFNFNWIYGGSDNVMPKYEATFNNEPINEESLQNDISWNNSIKSGDVLSFTATSISTGVDFMEVHISNITIVGSSKTQIGTEIKDVARKITKAYVGIPTVQSDGTTKSVARLWWDAFLDDFEYINNGDGTYTLTAWKGTLNGESSTELVIPNDSRVIL